MFTRIRRIWRLYHKPIKFYWAEAARRQRALSRLLHPGLYRLFKAEYENRPYEFTRFVGGFPIKLEAIDDDMYVPRVEWHESE